MEECRIKIDSRLKKYINFGEISKNINTICKKFQYLNDDICIHMVNSIKDMENKIGDSIPNWVIGTNKDNNVYILDYNKWIDKSIGNISEILLHEVVHVVINAVNYACPLWLNEGIALFYAGQIKEEMVNCNEECLNPYNLSYDDGLYNYSARVIIYLINCYGEEKIIDKIIKTMNFEDDAILGKKSIDKLIKKYN